MFDQAVSGRKKGSEHLSGHDPSLSIVLCCDSRLVLVPVRPKSDWTHASVLYSSSVKS